MPDNPLTRQEMAKILVLIYEENNMRKTDTMETVFADSGDISEWAYDYVVRASNYGLMNGVGSDLFSPLGIVSREQAMVAVYRLLDILN